LATLGRFCDFAIPGIDPQQRLRDVSLIDADHVPVDDDAGIAVGELGVIGERKSAESE